MGWKCDRKTGRWDMKGNRGAQEGGMKCSGEQ